MKVIRTTCACVQIEKVILLGRRRTATRRLQHGRLIDYKLSWNSYVHINIHIYRWIYTLADHCCMQEAEVLVLKV